MNVRSKGHYGHAQVVLEANVKSLIFSIIASPKFITSLLVPPVFIVTARLWLTSMVYASGENKLSDLKGDLL